MHRNARLFVLYVCVLHYYITLGSNSALKVLKTTHIFHLPSSNFQTFPNLPHAHTTQTILHFYACCSMPSSFHNRTLQCTLLFSFALACIILVFSHNAVVRHHPINDNDDTNKLLSVPLPPQIIRKAATGGLPPIPDFVKQKLDHDNQEDGLETTFPSYPFPSDAASETSHVILQPTFGSHRDTDAVFAFAEGYDLNVYVTFIESLKSTGFKGDVVLSVSHINGMKNGVEEYLKWYSQQPDDALRVVAYALQWECYKKSGTRILPTNNEGRGSTTNHGFSDCKIHGLYSGENNRPADDPRDARPVATARYELYWIWSKQYTATSSILIVDVRDTFFQSNPFTHPSSSPPSLQSESCKLDLFEENFAAVDIGRSQYNSRWIKSAYGQKVLKTMEKQPVICSGSTMGTQYAIELYSMAMVAQFDKTKCK